MNAHTPGPWAVVPSRGGILDARVVSNGGDQVATINTTNNTQSNRRANARLIAAAPSLKEAAHKALQALRHAPLHGPYGEEAKRMLEVALAQAEGTRL